MNSVLVSQKLKELIENKVITSSSRITNSQIQPASIDLNLGDEAYEIKSSFLPRKFENIEDILKFISIRKFNLENEPLLNPGKVYLVPLQESLSLLPWQRGIVNPKSSIGRIDLFVRCVVDNFSAFDKIPNGYNGRLYAILIPQSFSVLARSGVRLNQLRIIEGNPDLTDEELHLALRKHKILYGENPKNVNIDNGIYLSIALENGNKIFRAKKTDEPIDLSKEKEYKKRNFWDEIEIEEETINVEPGFFYVMATKEKIRMPLIYAGELQAIDVSLGEIRNHYAGFIDPGFGYGENGNIHGSNITLEIRALEHKFRLMDSQNICKINFNNLDKIPDRIYSENIGSNYGGQQFGPKVGKYFTE